MALHFECWFNKNSHLRSYFIAGWDCIYFEVFIILLSEREREREREMFLFKGLLW